MASLAAAVGVIANPLSGRDVRRLAARAESQTHESKRNQIQRIAFGAAAAGAERLLLVPDAFRVSQGAVEALRVPGAAIELLEVGRPATDASDTVRAAEAMRKAGCGALVVLGGDGTCRAVARAWRDVPLVALSTGTNNVFPAMIEATTAGAAAGLVASGRLPLDRVSTRAKRIEVELGDGSSRPALIDLALLEDDHPGSLMPFDAAKLRHLVLARAEPDAVGTSPIGGLLEPCAAGDDFAVEVRLGSGGRPLLAPISQGLYRTAYIESCHRLALDEWVSLTGPGVLAFDGDRELALAPGQRARARVVRDGPAVIDVPAALREAARRGLYRDRHWHEEGPGGFDCC